MKNFLYPLIPLKAIPQILVLALLGALIAGAYGIVHDQVTFSLAPEYFTKFKFRQFHYADFGYGDRVFVGTIGFLATWWVGMIAGWVVGRCSVLPDGNLLPRSVILTRFLWIVAVAFGFGVLGFLYGMVRADSVEEAWASWRITHGISDLARFARVGYIHNFGYLGALVGVVVSAILVRREVRKLGSPADAGTDDHN